eukprot:gb/GECH01013023.1/.p1 GENE.gb/GECH01013023.1/~~gb/GECH01013023.1/.p1  ORF type:complete len:253 (+),score=69.13 gb/GECH01013023.1/:1-759(+)
MGCDGGTAAVKRDIIVKQRKRKEKVDKETLSRTRWTSCCLSNKPLCQPVATCALGNLYNKDEVINSILEKSLPKDLSHIRSLKDLITLKLEKNPDFNPNKGNAPFLCPITQKELLGQQKTVTFDTCGHVVTQDAIYEVNNSTTELNKHCPVCEKHYNHTITLYPSDEERAEIKAKLATQKKNKKHSKKRKATQKDTPATKRMKTVSKVMNTPSENNKYEQSDVYKSLFVDPSKEEKNSNDFLVRAGMKSMVN